MFPFQLRHFVSAGLIGAIACAQPHIALGAQEAAPAATEKADTDKPSDGLAIVASIEQATTAAIDKAEQSIVAIARVRKDQARTFEPRQLLIPGQFPFSDAPENPDFVPSEFASGVVISSDGLIVTCAHALDDVKRYDYYVWLDRRVYAAQVVAKPAKVQASDPYSDLAVIKIDAQDLKPIVYGDANTLRKGQFCNQFRQSLRDSSRWASQCKLGNRFELAPRGCQSKYGRYIIGQREPAPIWNTHSNRCSLELGYQRWRADQSAR